MPDPRVIFKILAENQQAKKVLNDTATSFDKVQGAAGKMAIPAGIALGAITAGALSAVDSASNVQQAFGALESVYKDNADAAKKLAGSASRDVGLASSEYANLAAILGAQLNGMGVAANDLLPTTDKLISLGADLAATFGGTTSDAVEAISSLLRGERDPIEKYGVSLKQTDIDARLMADGVITAAKASGDLAKANKAVESANKAVERSHKGVITAQERLAAANKSGDPAKVKSAQRNLAEAKSAEAAAKATYKQATAAATASGSVSGLSSDAMKTATAQASLALLTKQTTDAQGQFSRESDTAAHAQQLAAASFEDAKAALGEALLPVVTQASTAFADMAHWVSENTRVVQVIIGVVAGLAAGILALNVILKVWQAATTVMTAIQWLLNSALLANPLTWVVIAIVALVAAVILAYQNCEQFRAVVDAVFAAVTSIIRTAVAFISAVIGTLVDIFRAPFNALLGIVRSVFGLVKSIIGLAMKVVEGIFTALVTTLGTIFKPLTDVLTGPFQKAKKVISDIFSALERIIRDVVARITGFLDGISRTIDKVAHAVDSVNPFAAGAPPAAGGAVAGPWTRQRRTARSGSGSSGPVTVNVYTTGDSMQAEQAVLRALRRQTRLNGGVVPALGWTG